MKKRKPAKKKKAPFTDDQLSILQQMIDHSIGLHTIELHTGVMIASEHTFRSPDPIRDEVETAREKLAAGFDLTPEEFPLPIGHSYFGKEDDGETPLVPGFVEHYFEELQKHQDQRKAYIATCSFFGLPDFETPS